MAKMATSSGAEEKTSTTTSSCGRLYVKYLVYFMTALGITLYFLAVPILARSLRLLANFLARL